MVNIFDGYIILMDWGLISNCSVNRTVDEITPSNGQMIADLILDFHLNPAKVELIGHSFGGQIVGFAGDALNGALGKITGKFSVAILIWTKKLSVHYKINFENSPRSGIARIR